MTINYELTPIRKDGTYGVRILICNGRGAKNRKRISTNLVVHKKDVVIQYNKERTRTHTRIKNQLLLDKINSFILQCREKYRNEAVVEEKVSTEKVVSVMLGNSNLPTFFSFWDEWLNLNKNQGKKNYRAARNSFNNFLGGRDIEFKELTFTLLTQYSNFLAGKERAQSLYLGAIRHIWNEAEMVYDDKMPHTPFKKFKVPRQKLKGQRAIDISIVQKIFSYDAPSGSRAELAKDCFILSISLMGMNAADLYDCSVMENGVIKYDRVKTRTRRDDAHMEVTLLEDVKELFNKYRSVDGDRVFVFSKRYKKEADFTRSLNIGLHQILGTAYSNVTFYAARHTWATIARNEIGASKSDVNDALIHVDRGMDVTDIYIKKDYRAVNRLNKQVFDWIKENLPSSQTGGTNN